MTMLEKHEEKHQHAFHDFDGLIEMRSNPVPRYFAFLFYGLVIWGAVFIGYFLLSGWSSQGEFAQEMSAHRQQMQSQQPTAGTPAVAADPAAQRAAGAKLFAENCAVCHGAAGEGGIGPALTAAEFRYGKEAAAVQDSITAGRPGGMPAFGSQFSAEQIDALVSHVLALEAER